MLPQIVPSGGGGMGPEGILGPDAPPPGSGDWIWLDGADAASVPASVPVWWHDKSPNDFDMRRLGNSQTAPTYIPACFNGRGAVMFDGSDDGLRNNAGTANKPAPWSMYMVYKSVSANPATYETLFASDNTDGNGSFQVTNRAASGPLSVRWRNDAGATGYVDIEPSGGLTDLRLLMLSVDAGGEIEAYSNGSLVSRTTPPGAFSGWLKSFVIAADASGNNPKDCYVAEVRIYDVYLSPAMKSYYHGHLVSKWGIVIA